MRISRLQNFAAVLALALPLSSCVFTLGVWGAGPAWRLLPDPEEGTRVSPVDAVASNRNPEAGPVLLALRVPTFRSDRPWLVLEPEWQTAAMSQCLERLRRGDLPTGAVGVTFRFDDAPSCMDPHGRLVLPTGAPSPVTEGERVELFVDVPCRARFQAGPPPAAATWPQERCISMAWSERPSHVGTTALRVVLTPVAVVADVVTLPIILVLWGAGALDQQAKKTFGD